MQYLKRRGHTCNLLRYAELCPERPEIMFVT
jgi:hypothetical protein